MAECTNKGLTCYNEWFISAIKSSKVNGELQEKVLLQNCIKCNNQVKSLIESNEDQPIRKYEEFRLNSTIILLLGSSSINSIPNISACEDLTPLIKSIPPIESDKIFVVIKGLKNYKFLRGILPWLPPNILSDLLVQFLDNSKSMTPLVLAICFEIFYSLVYSLQYEAEDIESLNDSLQRFITMLKSNEVEIYNKENNKLGAYHFTYMVEALHLLVCLLFKKEILEPYTYSLGLHFIKFRSNSEKKIFPQLDSIIKTALCDLLSICNVIIAFITSNIWIAWHSIKAPTFGLSTAAELETELDNSGKSIQLQVAYTMYKILKIIKDSESQEVLNLTSYPELNNFFNHCSIDPSYDFDTDLTNHELIEAIKNGDDLKKKKLIGILVGREDIFTSQDCLTCAKEQEGFLSKASIDSLINKLIDKILIGNEVIEEWKNVVVHLSKKLDTEQILTILKGKLNYGKSDCLKTLDFMFDLTQVFNQLSDLSNEECSNSFVWLCLQCGVEVVKNTVEMGLSLPGLAPVISPAIRNVYFICRGKDVDTDVSLMTKLLIDKLDTSLESGNESECLSLILNLLKHPDTSSFGPRTLPQHLIPIDISETLEHIVCPKLKWTDNSHSNVLFALQVLTNIAQLYPDTLLQSQAKLSSVIICVLLLHHNCNHLSSHNFGLNLSIRNGTEKLLRIIFKHIFAKKEDYCKEISLMKVIYSKYEMSPRSFELLSPLIGDQSTTPSTHVDDIFSLILNKSDFIDDDSVIPRCSRIQWIWALYMILPNCSEEEWLTSIHLTHSYLNANVGDTNLVTPTLKVYHETLLLLCDAVSGLKEEKRSVRDISLRHCFKCFSSVAMNFMNEKLKNEEKQFYTLVNTFKWWCACQKVFKCDPELPCLFLNNLCTSMNDLVKSEAVIIVNLKQWKNATKIDKDSTPIQHEELKVENAFSTRDESNVDVETGIKTNPSTVTKEGTRQDDPHSSDQITTNEDTNRNQNEPQDTIARKEETNEQELISNHATTKGGPNETTPKGKKSIPKIETITKEKYDQIMGSLVLVLVTTVSPNSMGSTIAGKLKTLCELVRSS